MGQSKVLRALGRIVCPPIFKLLYRYKTIGTENIPKPADTFLPAITYHIPILSCSGYRQKGHSILWRRLNCLKKANFCRTHKSARRFSR